MIRTLVIAAAAAGLSLSLAAPAHASLPVSAWASAQPAPSADRPAVRVLAGGAARSRIAGRTVAARARAFRFHGAHLGRVRGSRFLAADSLTSRLTSPPWSVSFVTTARRLEILARGPHARWRLRVDGRVAARGRLPAGTRSRRLQLTFAAAGRRELTLETADGLRWGGVVAPRGRLARSRLRLGPRAIFLGDSYTAGAGADAAYDSWAITAGRMLGWGDTWASGRGTTGYANPGIWDIRATFADRVVADVVRHRPDIVVVAGGINDAIGFFAPAHVSEGARRTFALLREQLPEATLVVVGPWMNEPRPRRGFYDYDAAIRAEARRAGATFIDNVGERWLDASNAGWVIGADGLHPTQRGHDYLAARFVAAARAAGL